MEAEKFRNIEAYIKAKISQSKGMIAIEENKAQDCDEKSAAEYWWNGMLHAYEDINRILFSNERIDVNNINIDE